MSIERSIKIAYNNKVERNWEKTYWAIDLHGTICPGQYSKDDLEGQRFYPMAEDVLTTLSIDPEIVLILWTCSHDNYINEYIQWFEKHGIRFDYVNANLESLSNDFQDFSKKFYCNVILDDKAGFDPATDWKGVLEAYMAHKR